jgi:hypothetical protein
MRRLWRRVASIAGRPLVLSQVFTSASGAIATILAAAFMRPDAFTQFALLNLVAITMVGLVRSFLFQPALIQFRHDKDAHTRFALSGSGALVSGVVLAGSAIALGVDTWWLVALLFVSALFPILQDWLRYRAMAADRRWDVALSDGLRLVFVLASPLLLIGVRDPALYQAYLGLTLAVPVVVLLIRLPRPSRFTPLREYIRPAGLQLADFAIGQFNSTLPLLVLGALGASNLIGGVRFAQTLLGPLNLVFAASTTNLIADGATRGTYASTEDLIRNGTRLARVIGLVAVVGVVVLTGAVAASGFQLHGVGNTELVTGLALVGAATLSSGWAGIHAIVMRLMGYQAVVTVGRAFLVFVSLSAFTIGYLLGGVDASLAAGFAAAAVAAPLAFIVPATVLYRRHRKGELVELGPQRAHEMQEQVELSEEDTPVRGLPDDSAPGTI